MIIGWRHALHLLLLTAWIALVGPYRAPSFLFGHGKCAIRLSHRRTSLGRPWPGVPAPPAAKVGGQERLEEHKGGDVIVVGEQFALVGL